MSLLKTLQFKFPDTFLKDKFKNNPYKIALVVQIFFVFLNIRLYFFF